MADISSIKLPDNTTYNLKDASAVHSVKQDGVTGATVNRYGVCDTAAATAAKTVSITTGTFSLEAGAMVLVKFTNANTANNPTLNVNSTGAKNIYERGAQITTNAGHKDILRGMVSFVYDGTQWHVVGNYYNTNDSVTQSGSTTANWRKLLMHNTSNADAPTAAVTETTGLIYAAVDISAQPSTGTIRANVFDVKDKCNIQYNATTESIDFVFT